MQSQGGFNKPHGMVLELLYRAENRCNSKEALAGAFGAALTDNHRRALVALWALEMPARVPAAGMPDAVHALYPEWIQRLADFLTAAADPYDRDFWAKDVRISLVLSVPGARTQMIDLSSPMGPGQVLRHAREGWGWSVVPAYAAAQAWAREQGLKLPMLGALA